MLGFWLYVSYLYFVYDIIIIIIIAYKYGAIPHRPTQHYTVQELNEMINLK